MTKPIEEYYLRDHGDGNGWQVTAKSPGSWGVCTQSSVKEHEGLVVLELERFYTGGLSTVDRDQFILTPEEAQLLKIQLHEASEQAWGNALETRNERKEDNNAPV